MPPIQTVKIQVIVLTKTQSEGLPLLHTPYHYQPKPHQPIEKMIKDKKSVVSIPHQIEGIVKLALLYR